jgi:hypothetical protein
MTNENQTNEQKEYDGVEYDINKMQQDLDAQRREAQKNSRFRQIEDGKTARLKFTGRAFKRTTSGVDAKGNPYTANKIDWELNEIVQEGPATGKSKLWSVGEANGINRDILANIQKGSYEMLISRTGVGKATTYKLTTFE